MLFFGKEECRRQALLKRILSLLSFDLGVYVKPTEEENRKFDERVKWLENVMAPRRELYEAEEKTLRVMLAEEEEEKEKERRENERKNQGTGLSLPSSFSIGVCILILFTYKFLYLPWSEYTDSRIKKIRSLTVLD